MSHKAPHAASSAVRCAQPAAKAKEVPFHSRPIREIIFDVLGIPRPKTSKSISEMLGAFIPNSIKKIPDAIGGFRDKFFSLFNVFGGSSHAQGHGHS